MLVRTRAAFLTPSLPLLQINFERIDSAVVARKTLNGRDVLGAEVGGVRIGLCVLLLIKLQSCRR
jgi:hypothetical protein